MRVTPLLQSPSSPAQCPDASGLTADVSCDQKPSSADGCAPAPTSSRALIQSFPPLPRPLLPSQHGRSIVHSFIPSLIHKRHPGPGRALVRGHGTGLDVASSSGAGAHNQRLRIRWRWGKRREGSWDQKAIGPAPASAVLAVTGAGVTVSATLAICKVGMQSLLPRPFHTLARWPGTGSPAPGSLGFCNFSGA